MPQTITPLLLSGPSLYELKTDFSDSSSKSVWLSSNVLYCFLAFAGNTRELILLQAAEEVNLVEKNDALL